MNPVVINRLQLRLAIELAAQSAAKAELEKQILDQLPPGSTIEVDGAEINVTKINWPSITILGREVVWQ